jgi:hypothetical protein
MIIITLVIIGVVTALIDKKFIEEHIARNIDPDDENF